MIDGTWWLVILLAIVIVLWLLAKSRGKSSHQSLKSPQKAAGARPSKSDLQKTAALIKKDLSEYSARRRKNHLLIIKQGKKVAMITIDKNVKSGQRRLGDMPIINYHRAPSRTQLINSLQAIDGQKESSYS